MLYCYRIRIREGLHSLARERDVKIIAQNRRARHDYFIEDSLECGIELRGTEVKSLRQGKVNLKESYAIVKDGEVLVQSMHISPYEQGSYFNTDPLRPKKLLLHKSEIRRLHGMAQKQGYTLIPLDIYLKNGRMKLNLGICLGKHLHDKRAAMADKDAKIKIAQAMREHSR